MSHSETPFNLSFIPRFLTWKNIFYSLVIIGLFLLPLLSLDAGISGDEEVHFRQSEKVINYYRTFGKDTSALDTPKSHLKYYGQSFDNLTTLLIQLFNIEDIYTFRHVCNSIVGWLVILFSGLLGVWLSGYRTGTFILLFMYLSPRFIGHLFNNLKDIPFALGYILAIYFIFRMIEGLPKPRFRYILFVILSVGLAVSIRIGGIILIFYLLLFTLLFLLSYSMKAKNLVSARIISRSFLVVLLVAIGGYLIGLVFWPYGLENPVKNPIVAFEKMANFPTTLRQIFEGEYTWSDQMPWYYVLKYIFITVPNLIWIGFLLFLVFMNGILKSTRWIFILFLVVSLLFPLFFVLFTGANLYGVWRHLLFVYPPLVILSGIGYNHLIQQYPIKLIAISTTVIIILFAILPARFMIRNHPYQYLYFNAWTGGIQGAYGKYETDYYFHSVREATDWLGKFVSKNEDVVNPVVASNFPITWDYNFKEVMGDHQYIKYYERGNSDWDYAIIGNSYIHPYQLKEKVWPPGNTIHRIEVEGVPVCIIIERPSKDDLRGANLVQEKKYQQAIPVLSRSLAVDPENESAYINLALAYFRMGKCDSAQVVLGKLERIYPDYDVALDLRARIFIENDDIESAKEVLTKILEINPKYYLAFYRLATIYLDENNVEQGIRYLKRCLRLNPKYNPALVKLGEYN